MSTGNAFNHIVSLKGATSKMSRIWYDPDA